MGALSERLKLLRKERGLSQDKLGEILNIPRTTIANWESGRIPELIAIQKLADYFVVSIDYLIGRSNIRNPLGTEERIEIMTHNDPEIDNFLEQLTYRDELKQIVKVLKDLPEKSIKRLIRVTLAIERDDKAL